MDLNYLKKKKTDKNTKGNVELDEHRQIPSKKIN